MMHEKAMIKTQFNVTHKPMSDSRDAFSKMIEVTPQSKHQLSTLNAALLETPLGPMVAVANETELYLLEFIDGRNLELEVQRLKHRTKSTITQGKTAPIASIETELNAYFSGQLRQFKTPLFLLGSPFQKRVWNALCTIPFGETRSYKEQAQIIDHPSAYRAVANANGANQIAIVIPCHRIITSSGELGGYGGGLNRKRWLIEFEAQALRDKIKAKE